MKTLIFSDVHGNLPALELMLKHAGRVDGFICLGDIVNYGPWSNECVDLITSLNNCIIIEGNHEVYFRERHYDSPNVSKKFFDFCLPHFDRFEKIAHLPKSIDRHNARFVHTLFDKNIYADTPLNLDRNYFIGHSHHQFKTNNHGFTLYNAGSVGQNRKFINVINYLILQSDDKSNTVEMRSLQYDEAVLLKEMRRLEYPAECIEYYNNKARL